MPNNASMTLENHPALIDKISLCIHQAILNIQQQHPEFLKEKYKTIAWNNSKQKSSLLEKLKQEFSKTKDRESINLNLQRILQLLFVPEYFDSSYFTDIRKQLTSILTASLAANTPEDSTSLSAGIAILLLDAENLQLDTKTEKFLASLCTYPIQIKIAFANWRSMGKQDVDYHGRGYELIHVPAGKDSADVKMATVGSSIFVHYPNAKEVLVCSSDGVLTHLCNTLQTHGLTVHLVRKQGDNITVLNNKTSETQTHLLKALPEVPPLEQAIAQLKEIIKAEQALTNNHWIKLSQISSLYHEKYKLTISQVVSVHLPGKRARDVFIENPQDFVVHQVSDKTEIYISLFDLFVSDIISSNLSQQVNPQTPPNNATKVKSKVELEQAIRKIINVSTAKSPGSYIPLNTLGMKFRQQYGQSATTIIKQLKLSTSFIKFLQSCNVFELKKIDEDWNIAIKDTK
jgi:hypothetical protein